MCADSRERIEAIRFTNDPDAIRGLKALIHFAHGELIGIASLELLGRLIENIGKEEARHRSDSKRARATEEGPSHPKRREEPPTGDLTS